MNTQTIYIKNKIFNFVKNCNLNIKIPIDVFMGCKIIYLEDNFNINNVFYFRKTISKLRHECSDYEYHIAYIYDLLGINMKYMDFKRLLTKKSKTEYEKFLSTMYDECNVDKALRLLSIKINKEIRKEYNVLAERYLIDDYVSGPFI